MTACEACTTDPVAHALNVRTPRAVHYAHRVASLTTEVQHEACRVVLHPSTEALVIILKDRPVHGERNAGTMAYIRWDAADRNPWKRGETIRSTASGTLVNRDLFQT